MATPEPPPAGRIDIAELRLAPGDVVVRELQVTAPSYRQSGTTFRTHAEEVAAEVQVAAYDGGYDLSLRVDVELHGPCARCLGDATVPIGITTREIHEPAADDDELRCGFVDARLHLDAAAWLQSAVALEFPQRVLCSDSCTGLCPQCGRQRDDGDCGCVPPETGSRWEKLRELRFDDDAGDAGE